MIRLTPIIRLLVLAASSLGGLLSCGCQNANYSGLEPTARTFRDNANPGDYYVGVDMNFILEDEPPHLHKISSTRPAD